MSGIKRHLEEVAYKYLEAHNLPDTDENWDAAMTAILDGGWVSV